ncbi:MAG: prepilin-type N-terminal cleavage/methylation domain-containing protein [Gemmatimonadota bacterium]
MNGRRAGLTLIEVLVAMSISSVVAVIGYTALSVLVDQSSRATSPSEIARGGWVRRSLGDWIRSALLIPGVDATGFQAVDRTQQDTARDELRFLTAATMPDGNRLTWVRIYIDRDSLTTEKGLTAELEPWGTGRPGRIELDSTIVGLDARYTSTLISGRKWFPSWVSSSVLPDAVELRFVATGSADSLTRLPLAVIVGAPK